MPEETIPAPIPAPTPVPEIPPSGRRQRNTLPDPATLAPVASGQYLFATEAYEKIGIACCPKCGAEPQTDFGQRVCAIGDRACPFLN